MANIIKVGNSAGGSAILTTKNITTNGTYNASSDNADGYSSVTVNVSGGGSTLNLHSGKVRNNGGDVVADNDYYYTDFFPCPNGNITFDIGTTGSFDFEGITIYDENEVQVYDGWWNPTQRYRTVDMSSMYASGGRKMRISFRASNIHYPFVHDWVNNVVYTTEDCVRFVNS